MKGSISDIGGCRRDRRPGGRAYDACTSMLGHPGIPRLDDRVNRDKRRGLPLGLIRFRVLGHARSV